MNIEHIHIPIEHWLVIILCNTFLFTDNAYTRPRDCCLFSLAEIPIGLQRMQRMMATNGSTSACSKFQLVWIQWRSSSTWRWAMHHKIYTNIVVRQSMFQAFSFATNRRFIWDANSCAHFIMHFILIDTTDTTDCLTYAFDSFRMANGWKEPLRRKPTNVPFHLLPLAVLKSTVTIISMVRKRIHLEAYFEPLSPLPSRTFRSFIKAKCAIKLIILHFKRSTFHFHFAHFSISSKLLSFPSTLRGSFRSFKWIFHYNFAEKKKKNIMLIQHFKLPRSIPFGPFNIYENNPFVHYSFNTN